MYTIPFASSPYNSISEQTEKRQKYLNKNDVKREREGERENKKTAIEKKPLTNPSIYSIRSYNSTPLFSILNSIYYNFHSSRGHLLNYAPLDAL